jgi:Colicin V production protein
MPVEHDDFFAVRSRKHFQSLAQVQFLRREQFLAETADAFERRRLDKNERTGQPSANPADAIPQRSCAARQRMMAVRNHRRAAGQNFAGRNFFRDVGKQFFARMRIGVHEHKPVAGGNARAGVAGAGDLVDRFENHVCAGVAGDFGGAVGGVIVANDKFKFPAALRERRGGGLDFRERCAEEFFLVESGDDDGNFHGGKITASGGFANGMPFSSCIFRGMFFNGGMTIWILAILVVAAAALAGWRQGAIRAAFATVGILFAWLLAGLAGKIFHPLLPHFGASNPITAWALAPVCGFILISILFAVAAQPVHKRVEHFYRYDAGDLRQALWERLNARVGICLGVLNGVLYFVLISFFVFNLGYVASQTSAAGQPGVIVRLASQLGRDLEANGLSRTACAVGKLPDKFYLYSDFAGFLACQKDPQFGARLAAYPGFTSLWERPELQSLVTDPTLTNALASGSSVGELLKDPTVVSFLENNDQLKLVTDTIQTNLEDLTTYLKTGKSAKFGDKLVGRWEFNPAVTVAWVKQGRPKMPASEMRALRAMWSQAYSNTLIVVAGDNQIFVKQFPKFIAQPANGQPNFTPEDWKGDWTANGSGYDLHLTLNGEDKFLTATAEDLRLTLKDGKGFLIFDRAD